jgi:microcystin-dependent protein
MSLSRGTKEEAFSILPAGTVLPFAGSTAPSGWALCDGSTVSRADNPELYLAVGDAWGNGDGSTTFHLPDMRGKFMRGTDNAAGNDPDSGTRTAANAGGNTGDNVGTVQGDGTNSAGLSAALNGDHRHFTQSAASQNNVGLNTTWPESNGVPGLYGGRYSTTDATVSPSSTTGAHVHTVSGGNVETRPLNANMNYIIKL